MEPRFLVLAALLRSKRLQQAGCPYRHPRLENIGYVWPRSAGSVLWPRLECFALKTLPAGVLFNAFKVMFLHSPLPQRY